jgi:hypothetical protein
MIRVIVQRKLLDGGSVGTVPPVGKEMISETLLIRQLEISGRNDLIGVDIVDQQWNDP